MGPILAWGWRPAASWPGWAIRWCWARVMRPKARWPQRCWYRSASQYCQSNSTSPMLPASPNYLDDIERELGCLDVLVNNAAILYDTWQQAVDADLAVVAQALETNLYGAWRMAQACVPLMRRGGYGRIVNVSSEAGSLSGMGGGTPGYSVLKAALNALTRMMADELRGSGILVNSVCPGWVGAAAGPFPKAHAVSSGPPPCPTMARPADSSAMGGRCRGSARCIVSGTDWSYQVVY